MRMRSVVIAALVAVLSACSPAATEPTPSPSLAPTPPASPAPTATAAMNTLKQRVYFARDLLPPTGVDVDTALKGPDTAESRIAARLEALVTAKAPEGAMNMVPTLRTKPTLSAVRIEGDLATIDYAVPNGDWGSAGTAGTLALIQQLIYTASEEPGIRRVLITENGGRRTIVDGVEIDGPNGREAVLGYGFGGETIDSAGEAVATTLGTTYTVDDTALGLARVVVELTPASPPPEGRWIPAFTARLREHDGRGPVTDGKWILELRVPGGHPATTSARVDRTPLRAIQAVAGGYDLYLDDARPWRVGVEPGGGTSMRIVADVGGPPQAVNKNIAVYVPRGGSETGRTLTLSGAARVFEANVSWRVRDSGGREVARGNTTATLGTSPVWGTFRTQATVPANVSGTVTLEVFWGSPRDGSDQDVVPIQLTVR